MKESTGTPAPQAAPNPSLADPATCGEDLTHNLKRAVELAPVCNGCADYHVFNALRRLSGKTSWARGTREALLNTLRVIFTESAAISPDGVDVVVAGAADTGVLSTCAHAAWLNGRDFLDQTRFTVLDRCGSPLAMCEDYGARHGLSIHTEIVDLLEVPKVSPADIIVVHNLLSFLPQSQHVRFLRMLGGWLKQAGSIALWSTIMPPDDRDATDMRQGQRIAELKAMISNGRIKINGPKDVFLARLEGNIESDRPGESVFSDKSTLPNLVASAGLEAWTVEEVFIQGTHQRATISSPWSSPAIPVIVRRKITARSFSEVRSPEHWEDRNCSTSCIKAISGRAQSLPLSSKASNTVPALPFLLATSSQGGARGCISTPIPRLASSAQATRL